MLPGYMNKGSNGSKGLSVLKGKECTPGGQGLSILGILNVTCNGAAELRKGRALKQEVSRSFRGLLATRTTLTQLSGCCRLTPASVAVHGIKRKTFQTHVHAQFSSLA
jgi:hypothetical protein